MDEILDLFVFGYRRFEAFRLVNQRAVETQHFLT